MKPAAFIWLAAAAALAVAAFLAGRALHGGEQPVLAFDLTAPSYQGAALPRGLSRAGFTGFNDVGGIEGSVLIAGRLTAVAKDSISLSTSSGPASIRFAGERSLRRIESASSAVITPGSTVVVIRSPGTDEAAAVLLLSGP